MISEAKKLKPKIKLEAYETSSVIYNRLVVSSASRAAIVSFHGVLTAQSWYPKGDISFVHAHRFRTNVEVENGSVEMINKPSLTQVVLSQYAKS